MTTLTVEARNGIVTDWLTVTLPGGFTMTPPFTILKCPWNSVFMPSSWDVSDLEPTTTATMYVSITGDDGNDGSTLVLAKRSIENAISSMNQATTIWLADGEYVENYDTGYGGHWRQANPAYTFSIKAINSGSVIVSPRISPSRLVWSVHSGAAYKANYANDIQSIWDGITPTSDGDYVKLAAESSVANVIANAGTWYLTGGVVYAHLVDGRAPDSDLHVYRDMAGAYCARDNITIYIEGIEFQGGPNGAAYFRNNSATGGLNVYAKDCVFKYSFATGGLSIEGADLTISQDCTSAANDNDGFNYHARNAIAPDAIEINCIGRNNGTSSDADNQASSMHDGGRVLRINGDYYECYGQIIADVNSALSMNLGVEAHHGLSAGVANILIDGTMWLDWCNSHDHAAGGYDLEIVGAGDALYYANLTTAGDNNNGGGTLATFTPVYTGPASSNPLTVPAG